MDKLILVPLKASDRPLNYTGKKPEAEKWNLTEGNDGNEDSRAGHEAWRSR